MAKGYDKTNGAALPPASAGAGSAAEAAKRVKGTVTIPKLDENGEREFHLDEQTKTRVYHNETVPVGPEHILAVKNGYVVTVDGQKLPMAAK